MSTRGSPRGEMKDDDARIITGLRQRDDAVLAELLGRVQRWVIRHWDGFSVDDAQDIAGIAVVRAWKGVRSYRSHASAMSWVLGIARNVCLDWLKVKGREARSELASDEPVDAEDWETQLLCEMALEEALAELSDDEQQVIALRYMQGLSIAETARQVGRSDDAVKSLAKRAMSKLGQRLAEWDE